MLNLVYHDTQDEKVYQVLSAWRVKDEPVPKAQPYDNGHLESFNGSLRDELLNAELFYALGEARAKMESWLNWYNGERPHQSLGYRTPLEVWETTAPLGVSDACLPWLITWPKICLKLFFGGLIPGKWKFSGIYLD